jgi:hypothetical protein
MARRKAILPNRRRASAFQNLTVTFQNLASAFQDLTGVSPKPNRHKKKYFFFNSLPPMNKEQRTENIRAVENMRGPANCGQVPQALETLVD